MTIQQPGKPTFAFQYFRAFSVAALIMFVVSTIDVLLHPLYPHPIFHSVALRLIQGLFIAPLTVALAYLCIRRAPENIIGWLLMTFGTCVSIDALRADFGSPLFRAMVGFVSVLHFWIANLLIPCYFPNGRLFPARFEQWGNRVIALILALLWLTILGKPEFDVFLKNELTTGRYSAPNPFYIPALKPIENILAAIILVVFLYGIGSLMWRYRAANFHGRLQIRWLLSAYLFTFAVGFVPISWVKLATTVAFGFIAPITIVYAILRHRLYDIDIIIRKTLVYSVLTGILGTVYFGGVILTQQIVRAFIGQSGGDLGIVLSTLLIAALFNPLRRRIQDIIDRRFYRRKYDAEKTLATFSQSMRDEVDIETLKAQLVGVVNDTMQPDKIALWVREPGRGSETQ